MWDAPIATVGQMDRFCGCCGSPCAQFHQCMVLCGARTHLPQIVPTTAHVDKAVIGRFPNTHARHTRAICYGDTSSRALKFFQCLRRRLACLLWSRAATILAGRSRIEHGFLFVPLRSCAKEPSLFDSSNKWHPPPKWQFSRKVHLIQIESLGRHPIPQSTPYFYERRYCIS